MMILLSLIRIKQKYRTTKTSSSKIHRTGNMGLDRLVSRFDGMDFMAIKLVSGKVQCLLG